MADDIDMWNDIEELGKIKDKNSKVKLKILEKAYLYAFIEHDEDKAKLYKNKYQTKFNDWGNYY